MTVLLVLGLLNSFGSEFLQVLTEGVFVVTLGEDDELELGFDVGGFVLHVEVCEKLNTGIKTISKNIFFIPINIS
jgi:hypothetical protein